MNGLIPIDVESMEGYNLIKIDETPLVSEGDHKETYSVGILGISKYLTNKLSKKRRVHFSTI